MLPSHQDSGSGGGDNLVPPVQFAALFFSFARGSCVLSEYPRSYNTAAATLRPPLTPLVVGLNEYCTWNAPPWFTWCSIQVVRPQGTDTMGLRTHLRAGAPMALIVCVGSFTGGDFWVECGGLLNPSVRDKKRNTRVCKGRAVEGWACKATPQAPVFFNIRALHAALPWEGERWSVIFYSAGGLLHCTPTWWQQFVDLGFRVPNACSNPSS